MEKFNPKHNIIDKKNRDASIFDYINFEEANETFNKTFKN